MSIGVNLRVTGHTSIGGRKYQEDYFSVAYQQTENDQNLEYAYFGIYDGHGGAEASLYAKEHLMNTIVSQKLFWSENDEDVLKSIREGYIQTHYSMWREQDKWPKTSSGLPSTAGTTASIAFIRRGKIYIGHVGDSGIVLGFQNNKESAHHDDSRWVASALTEDHKPESYAEKMRIMSCGGKVVTKSGVPRVVWNRPRIGHKGPVRRSTPIDEIPFLAVARSLGDLWSYNSAMDEFIVSPVPDVSVIEIDPKKFRCLIFGTDGLWNVLSPKSAVEIVRNTEMENIRIALEGGNEWKNPSKLLVNEALERWSRSNMKADNTSVVIIMLDPPGPPKRDVLKSVKHTIQHASPDCHHGAGAAGSNMFDLFDCITRGEAFPALPELASRSENPAGSSLRYLHHHHHHHNHHQHYNNYHDRQQSARQHRESVEQYGSNQPHLPHHHLDTHLHAEQYSQPGPSTSYHHDLAYTDTSFAESYNSLLDHSLENTDHSYTTLFHPSDESSIVEEAAAASYPHTAGLVEAEHEAIDEDEDDTIIDYLPENEESAELMGRDQCYSLTNLQTKSERLRAGIVDSSHAYYHHHPHQHRADEGGCSGGNLAIIEHFHNYHHPPPQQYGGSARDLKMNTDEDQHQHHQMYQMDMTQQYLHQGGSNYQQNHFPHTSPLYQMERYDYRHPPGNNLLDSEPSCRSPSKQKAIPEYGYSNAYEAGASDIADPGMQLNEEDADEVDDETTDEQHSGDVHHIQINEISSSFVGSSNASPILLSSSDSEETGNGCGSGDEENNASSTTHQHVQQQLVMLPALTKPRAMKKPSSSGRVITIFYETRSSRRRPRKRNPTSGLFSQGAESGSRSLAAPFSKITKRRKAPTAAVLASAISNSAPINHPALTVERRVLRSNGINPTTSEMVVNPARSSTLPKLRVHLQRLEGNHFNVSSTTLEHPPSTHGATSSSATVEREGKPSRHVSASRSLYNRRAKQDTAGSNNGQTFVASPPGNRILMRNRISGVTAEEGPTSRHQRTRHLRRTTQC